MPPFTQLLPSFRTTVLLSVVIRIGLILYSEWHDAHSVVKYTDVDYRVFTDAARFLANPRQGNHAQGSLARLLGWDHFIGNPYSRETYRYTPLLALLLTPNEWLHPSFGKYLFAACDIINGIIIYRLLKSQVLPHALLNRSPPANSSPSNGSRKENTPSPPTQRFHFSSTNARVDRLATAYAALHLLNPMVFSISTRGSSESVLALFVLLTLNAAIQEKWHWAAVWLGIATHWKIYPVIYGVACLGVIGAPGSGISRLINKRTIWFGVASAGTFALLGAGCYAVWGYPFLYESYLYHLHRLDHRHNFSPYFYLTYLTYPTLVKDIVAASSWSLLLRSPLVSFVPQMTLALGTGLLYGRRKEDLPFAWFVQTVVFVLFNKVCTSQYFLWYLLLLPLLLPRLVMTRLRATSCIAVWIGTQALWLAEAYQLEFLGKQVFLGLWVRSLIYVVGNCWVLVEIMDRYDQ